MSHQARPTPTSRHGPQTPEEIEAEIELQREQLAGTIDALSAKLDVKSQAQAKVAEVKGRHESGRRRPRASSPPRPRGRDGRDRARAGGAADERHRGRGQGPGVDARPRPRGEARRARPTSHKRSWMYVGRKVMREFSEDQCTDQAAGLTYYAVLAIFPAALALLSLVSLFIDADKAVAKIDEVLSRW